jgi:hypothetical protein
MHKTVFFAQTEISSEQSESRTRESYRGVEGRVHQPNVRNRKHRIGNHLGLVVETEHAIQVRSTF